MLVPYKCLSFALRRQVRMHLAKQQGRSKLVKTTFALVSKESILSILDLDTELFTAEIRWGDVHAVLMKLGSYLKDSKWTHWKIGGSLSADASPQSILTFAWAFPNPLYHVIALVHQDPPFQSPLLVPERCVRCALKIDEATPSLQWQKTCLHIQAADVHAADVYAADVPIGHCNVSITFYPPIMAWAQHMNDDVQLCINSWLNESHFPHVFSMRYFSHIIYSYTREPMYVRQYYTSDLLKVAPEATATSDLQAFFLRKVYLNLNSTYQYKVPALYQEEWWLFRNAILSIVLSSHHAARVIQRAWRCCIASPLYALCRKRLWRECHGLQECLSRLTGKPVG